jgi:hypothetical protein
VTGTPAPSAEGIAIKLARAQIHRYAFKQHVWDLDHFGSYRFAGKVHGNGAKHVYRAVDPPPLAPNFSAILGDCIHNFRSALDHLACQLVIASDGTPSNRTQFPFHKSRAFWNESTRAREPVRIDIHPGIRSDIIQAVEAVQPYHGTFETTLLWWMHELDNIDKHRQLVVTASAVRGFGRSAFLASGATNPLGGRPDINRQPLKHNQVVLSIPHDPPRQELDPNLYFMLGVEFGNGPVKGYEVTFVLDNLADFLCRDLIPSFMRFF